ncbi:MAG TPA: hypothetical protein VN688_25925 [Gemmataceae bacterium]|nr:hypothetical protein [Gemmataceae bacterium]
MKCKSWRSAILFSLVVASATVLGGCGQTENKNSQSKDMGTTPKEKPGQVAANDGNKKVHDHSGWWCDEHGVPEAECSMCSAKVAAAFKKKGDWCEKHDRAKSQCFICDPSLEAKYAARYEAKYGKKPPIPEHNHAPKEDK